MRKVNITIEMHEEEILGYESWIREQTPVNDLTILPDTEKLYKDDSNFRELCMKVKSAKRVRNDYINKHNFK